ncbi:MAG: beta-galactosidase, partial [Ruthenibacterium sp.]
ELWENALDKLIQAGCNAVAYYVPWFVHEPEEGVFDFNGRLSPAHDLHAWIKLTMQKGLIALFRPGPYIYAETTDLGIPRWFTTKYPDTHPKKYVNGHYENYGFERYTSHNSPQFLSSVRAWFSAVRKEIAPYLAPEGNIWMIQLCNEIPGDDHMDENPQTLGIGNPNGIFPRYLREKYDTISVLNALYGTAFEQFDTVAPHQLKEASPDLCEDEKRCFYYNFYYPLYFRTLKEYLGELPSQIILFHNAYNPKAVSLHTENQRQNPWLNVGVDCYYSLFGSLSLKEGVYFCEYGAQYAAAMLNNAPWVVEQECGYWNDYPQVYGAELYLWNIWTIAAGYRGFNMYLFS